MNLSQMQTARAAALTRYMNDCAELLSAAVDLSAWDQAVSSNLLGAAVQPFNTFSFNLNELRTTLYNGRGLPLPIFDIGTAIGAARDGYIAGFTAT